MRSRHALRATLALLAGLLAVVGIQAAENDDPPALLSDLAAAADLVALAQVEYTDYTYTRSFPSSGIGFLRVLIPYRLTQAAPATIAVREEGLHRNECYFEPIEWGVEGTRHLVFLRLDPEQDRQYIGLEAGCALQVLVTADNRYALRYPPSGIAIRDALAELARPMRFADRHAVLAEEDISVEERNELLAGGYLERLADGRYRYTHGVALADVRPLLGEENLTLDREIRRSLGSGN